MQLWLSVSVCQWAYFSDIIKYFLCLPSDLSDSDNSCSPWHSFNLNHLSVSNFTKIPCFSCWINRNIPVCVSMCSTKVFLCKRGLLNIWKFSHILEIHSLLWKLSLSQIFILLIWNNQLHYSDSENQVWNVWMGSLCRSELLQLTHSWILPIAE